MVLYIVYNQTVSQIDKDITSFRIVEARISSRCVGCSCRICSWKAFSRHDEKRKRTSIISIIIIIINNNTTLAQRSAHSSCRPILLGCRKRSTSPTATCSGRRRSFSLHLFFLIHVLGGRANGQSVPIGVLVRMRGPLFLPLP